jgi:hypothetical protein
MDLISNNNVRRIPKLDYNSRPNTKMKLATVRNEQSTRVPVSSAASRTHRDEGLTQGLPRVE